jgi:hypothetical protein
MEFKRRAAGIVRVNLLRRMLTASSHVVDMSSLLHPNKAREVGETEVTAINVGWREEVCWVTDASGFEESNCSPSSRWEAKLRKLQPVHPDKTFRVTDTPSVIPIEGMLNTVREKEPIRDREFIDQ